MILNKNAYIFVCGDGSQMAKVSLHGLFSSLLPHKGVLDERSLLESLSMLRNMRTKQDVHAALIEVLKENGGLSQEDSQNFIVKLVNDRKYIRDIWS